jgi:hypothetical protein
MNREEYIKHREELIKVILKKCVTDNYPMVEKITIHTGKERCGNLFNPYNYIFYYTIGIKCSPDFFCKDKFQTIKDCIRFIQPYFLEQNEHIRRVDNLVDFKINFPTF